MSANQEIAEGNEWPVQKAVQLSEKGRRWKKVELIHIGTRNDLKMGERGGLIREKFLLERKLQRRAENVPSAASKPGLFKWRGLPIIRTIDHLCSQTEKLPKSRKAANQEDEGVSPRKNKTPLKKEEKS